MPLVPNKSSTEHEHRYHMIKPLYIIFEEEEKKYIYIGILL